MNWLDILILVTLVILGVLGFRTGIVKVALTAVGFVLGILLARRFGESLGHRIDFINNQDMASIVGFLVILVMLVLGAWVISSLIQSTLKRLFLGWLDNTAGATLGVLTGSLIFTAIIAIGGSIPSQNLNTTIQNSSVARFFANKAPLILLDVVPEGYNNVLSYLVRVEDPEATVASLEVQKNAEGGANLVTHVTIANPNTFGGSIQRVSYRVSWDDGNQLQVLGAAEQTNLQLKASEDTNLELPLSTAAGEYGSVDVMLESLERTGSVKLQASGIATVAFPSKTSELFFVGTQLVSAQNSLEH